MINKELISKRIVLKKVEIEALGELYFRTATVRDVKAIQKEVGEVDQLVTFIAMLAVQADGTPAFTKDMVLDMDMELLNQLATAMQEAGIVPNVQA